MTCMQCYKEHNKSEFSQCRNQDEEFSITQTVATLDTKRNGNNTEPTHAHTHKCCVLTVCNYAFKYIVDSFILTVKPACSQMYKPDVLSFIIALYNSYHFMKMLSLSLSPYKTSQICPDNLDRSNIIPSIMPHQLCSGQTQIQTSPDYFGAEDNYQSSSM